MTSDRNNYFHAVKVVSPMCDGQDRKDQDRAVWFPTALSACVCDGVTSSPFAAEAAELVARFSPVLFLDNCNHTLKILCDHLMILREERINSKIDVSLSDQPQVQEMVQEVVLEKMKSGYQTTMVAAKFTPESKAVGASVIKCGDSTFFAFTSDGELLTAVPSDGPKHKRKEKQTFERTQTGQLSNTIEFLPGEELLAKLLCNCSNYPDLAAKLGIKQAHMGNWVICKAVDKCRNNGHNGDLAGRCAMQLGLGELLAVPKYLTGAAVQAGDHRYVRFPYSGQIRRMKFVSNSVGVVNFQQLSSTTFVLPDHFYTGDWIYFQDKYPLDANFLLSSDGFYRCFNNPSDLWSWLNSHKKDLQDPQKQAAAMDKLHSQLRAKHGDDDIAFVWIYPSEAFCEEE